MSSVNQMRCWSSDLDFSSDQRKKEGEGAEREGESESHCQIILEREPIENP